MCCDQCTCKWGVVNPIDRQMQLCEQMTMETTFFCRLPLKKTYDHFYTVPFRMCVYSGTMVTDVWQCSPRTGRCMKLSSCVSTNRLRLVWWSTLAMATRNSRRCRLYYLQWLILAKATLVYRATDMLSLMWEWCYFDLLMVEGSLCLRDAFMTHSVSS